MAIQSHGQTEHGQAEYNQLLQIFTASAYSVFLLLLSWAQQLERDVSADVGFLCDKSAVLGVASKEGSHTVAISLSNTRSFF